MGNITNPEPLLGWAEKKKAVCFTCKHRNGEPPFADGPLKAHCIKYPEEKGYMKPKEVIFDGANCPHYEFDSTTNE